MIPEHGRQQGGGHSPPHTMGKIVSSTALRETALLNELNYQQALPSGSRQPDVQWVWGSPRHREAGPPNVALPDTSQGSDSSRGAPRQLFPTGLTPSTWTLPVGPTGAPSKSSLQGADNSRGSRSGPRAPDRPQANNPFPGPALSAFRAWSLPQNALSPSVLPRTPLLPTHSFTAHGSRHPALGETFPEARYHTASRLHTEWSSPWPDGGDDDQRRGHEGRRPWKEPQ